MDDKTPWIAAVKSSARDDLSCIDDGTSADRKNHIDLIIFTDFHTLTHRFDSRIRFHARQFINPKACCSEDAVYLVVKTVLLNASSSIYKKYFRTAFLELCEVLYLTFSKVDLRRDGMRKIIHLFLLSVYLNSSVCL